MKRALVVAAAIVFAPLLHAGGPANLVVMPFENIGGSDIAEQILGPIVDARAKGHGWTVIERAAVAQILEEQRVRYVDSLEEATRKEIATKLNGNAFLFVTIDAWREGENPLVALSGRAIDANGELLWIDASAVTSADTERILARGRQTAIGQIAKTSAARLFREFPGPGKSHPVRGDSGSMFERGPRTFRSAALPRGERPRICLLPIDAPGAPSDASRVVGDMLALRLAAANDFDLVEPAQFRAAARRAMIRSFRNIGSTELQALAGEVGTPLFLRGTIFTYRDVPPRMTKAFPELQIELMLVDVRSGQIVWTSTHGRKGDDYEGLLLLGSVSNMVSLADRVVSEMIGAFEHARLRGPKR